MAYITKGKEKVFRTFNEWEKHYLPSFVEQRKVDEIRDDPEKLGEWLANAPIEKIRKYL